MLKQISRLGTALGSKEQKTIHGGRKSCEIHAQCGAGNCCSSGVCWPFGTPGHLCDPPGNL